MLKRKIQKNNSARFLLVFLIILVLFYSLCSVSLANNDEFNTFITERNRAAEHNILLGEVATRFFVFVMAVTIFIVLIMIRGLIKK